MEYTLQAITKGYFVKFENTIVFTIKLDFGVVAVVKWGEAPAYSAREGGYHLKLHAL